MAKQKSKESSESGRVFIFPTLQMNVVNYREDEDTLLALLKYFSDPKNGLNNFKLATGYFNLQQEIVDLLNSNQDLKTDILTSSPRANGFYKAGRFKKYIPGMYRANELRVLSSNKKQGNIQIHEWENGEATYHAKGAWLYENAAQHGPSMTVIGSSNYSYRSNRRDTEAQLYMVSDCPQFQRKLHGECEHLFSKSTPMTVESVKNDGTDKLTIVERALSRALKILL